MQRHLPTASNYNAIVWAIGQALQTRYQPPNELSPELRRLVRLGPCCNRLGDARRPRQSHEMWLTDNEPRRMAEISLRFLGD